MKEDLFKIIATQNKQMLNKFFAALPNPNLTIATIGDRQATLENIANDPHVASCIQSRKSGVLSQTWEIQPASEINDFISTSAQLVFNRLDLYKIISEMLNAPLFGFQVLEIVWKIDYISGVRLIVPAVVQGKPQKWFSFDPLGIPRFKNFETKNDEILLPYKFIVLQYQATYENPYGEAILSKCLWPVVFKKAIVTFWAKFAEKFGMPHFVGKTDSVATTEDYDKFLEILDNLIQDGSAVISNTETIEILNANTVSSAQIYKEFIDFCNAEISKAILSQTLTTELGNVGSYAASKVHFVVREEIVKSDRMLIEKGLNQIIKWFVDLNFGKQTEYPKLIIFKEEDVDKPLAETIKTLKDAGIQVLEPFIVRRLGLQKNEFKILDSSSQGNAISPNQLFAENDIPKDQQVIDSEVESSVSDQTGLDVIINKVKDFLEKQDDFDSAIKKIFDLFPDIPTKQLEQELTNRLFAAYLIGRISVQQELGNTNG